MDDLKNLVIQNLEQEGTLGALRAQLRARVFKSIEAQADQRQKQAAGFQMQSPAAQKIHDDPDAKLIALLIREYMEHYRMDYSLSVYLPEVVMQTAEIPDRKELATAAGLSPPAGGDEQPLLVQLLKTLREKQNEAVPPVKVETNQVQSLQTAAKPAKPNPFGRASAAAEQTNPVQDDIEEEIVDHEDIHLQEAAADALGASGASISASAQGVDQSIDTLNLGDYDYVEEVRPSSQVNFNAQQQAK